MTGTWPRQLVVAGVHGKRLRRLWWDSYEPTRYIQGAGGVNRRGWIVRLPKGSLFVLLFGSGEPS